MQIAAALGAIDVGQVQDAVELANSLPARVASCQIKDGCISLRFWPEFGPGNSTVPGGPNSSITREPGTSDADMALAGHEILPDPEPEESET